MLKKLLKFIVIIIPWFLGIILIKNINFLNEINKPVLMLPNFSLIILYIISYMLLSIGIYKILNKNYFEDIKNLIKIILINFIFSQLYLFIIFTFKNIFLGFVDSILILLSSLFLYYEVKETEPSISKYLILYVYFSLYISILNLIIYFMNF